MRPTDAASSASSAHSARAAQAAEAAQAAAKAAGKWIFLFIFHFFAFFVGGPATRSHFLEPKLF